MSEVYHVVQPLPLKSCSQCRKEKSIDDFYKVGGKNSSTFRTECKDCTLHNQKIKLQQKRNKELVQLLLPPFVSSKKCTKCKKERAIEHFAQGNPYTSDGYSYRCKDCLKADAQERSQKVTDLPISKLCGRCHAEKPLKQFPVSTGYGKYGRASVCTDCAGERWQENKDKYMATNRQWRKANPLKDLKRSQGYTARKKNAGIINSVDYDKILERDGMWCYICNQDILVEHKIHFDHVIPLARGGTHSEENLKPTHMVCNVRKQEKFLEEMTDYQRRGPAN